MGGHASPLRNVMSSFSPTTCDQPGVWVQGLPMWTEGAWGANAGVEGMNGATLDAGVGIDSSGAVDGARGEVNDAHM